MKQKTSSITHKHIQFFEHIILFQVHASNHHAHAFLSYHILSTSFITYHKLMKSLLMKHYQYFANLFNSLNIIVTFHVHASNHHVHAFLSHHILSTSFITYHRLIKSLLIKHHQYFVNPFNSFNMIINHISL
jgi:hypothetical protein